MRARDLRPDVIYATCDGNPIEVVPSAGGLIHANWQKFVHKDGKTTEIIDLTGPVPAPEDAWAKCVKAKPTDGYLIGSKGLCVFLHEFDRKGITQRWREEPQILDPKDIVGTWADFRKLHSDVIRDRYDHRVKEWLRKEFSWQLDQINEALKPHGVRVSTESQWSRSSRGGRYLYRHEASVSFVVVEEDANKDVDPAFHWDQILQVLQKMSDLPANLTSSVIKDVVGDRMATNV